MTLVAPFPPWLLALHSYAGALLLLSVLAQKWLVKSMSAGLLFVSFGFVFHIVL
jgi:hypothetical protein